MLDSIFRDRNNCAVADSPRTSTAARIGWAILILATLYICYFSHLGAIGFVGPDEPRYAWIARDMAETGDWITPRLYGKPWFEKPPLFYWGAAVGFKLFGVSEAAARLPSAISALLATLALAWLALRLYGAETARWLLLLLPTTVGMIGFSHAAATDMPFSACSPSPWSGAAVVLGLNARRKTLRFFRARLGSLSFSSVSSSASLSSPKAPPPSFSLAAPFFFWALFTKRGATAFRLFHPAALASFCLTALPWYIVCARRNPDFFRNLHHRTQFQRYLTRIPAPPALLVLRSRPPHRILSMDGDLFHPSKGCDAWMEECGEVGSANLFLACWPVFTFVFFRPFPSQSSPAMFCPHLLLSDCCWPAAFQCALTRSSRAIAGLKSSVAQPCSSSRSLQRCNSSGPLSRRTAYLCGQRLCEFLPPQSAAHGVVNAIALNCGRNSDGSWKYRRSSRRTPIRTLRPHSRSGSLEGLFSRTLFNLQAPAVISNIV